MLCVPLNTTKMVGSSPCFFTTSYLLCGTLEEASLCWHHRHCAQLRKLYFAPYDRLKPSLTLAGTTTMDASTYIASLPEIDSSTLAPHDKTCGICLVDFQGTPGVRNEDATSTTDLDNIAEKPVRLM